jgi:hypothetical protein
VGPRAGLDAVKNRNGENLESRNIKWGSNPYEKPVMFPYVSIKVYRTVQEWTSSSSLHSWSQVSPPPKKLYGLAQSCQQVMSISHQCPICLNIG